MWTCVCVCVCVSYLPWCLGALENCLLSESNLSPTFPSCCPYTFCYLSSPPLLDHRKNAFNSEMYVEVVTALGYAASHEEVVLAVLTGAGDYYSSGNDLANFMSFQGDPKKAAQDAAVNLET